MVCGLGALGGGVDVGGRGLGAGGVGARRGGDRGIAVSVERRGLGRVVAGLVLPVPDRRLEPIRPAWIRSGPPGIDPRGLDTQTQRVSISQEETFARDIADVEQLRAELRPMAEGLAEHLRKTGETARTVTTKVRYPDFAIRSRSTTLPVGTDDADRIWELACALLDRALADRPGSLRLVGVGLSGLEPHRQLTIM